MIAVNVPQNLSLKNALNFCNRLWQLDHSEEYIFDFKNLDHIEPFTMAYVSNEIKRFRQTKQQSQFKAANHENKSYAAHMGFFKAFGLQFGNSPGQAKGSNDYIPITILQVSDLQAEATQESVYVGNVIEDRSEKIARILTRMDNGDLVDTLTFAIREIFRNVVEHSNSEIIEYCAQYWPSKKLVEVVVMDTGIGVKKGLSSNPFLNPANEKEALQLALLPGVSGKMYKGKKKNNNDEWQNSGFGLYMTSRICRNGGDFFILSNDKCILLEGTEKSEFECSFQGTALRLRIKTDRITKYSEMLARYRREGFAAAKKFNGADAIEPSLASTMLTRDFENLS